MFLPYHLLIFRIFQRMSKYFKRCLVLLGFFFVVCECVCMWSCMFCFGFEGNSLVRLDKEEFYLWVIHSKIIKTSASILQISSRVAIFSYFCGKGEREWKGRWRIGKGTGRALEYRVHRSRYCQESFRFGIGSPHPALPYPSSDSQPSTPTFS